MVVPLDLVFVAGILFVGLWLTYICMDVGFAKASADPTGRLTRAALSKVLPLTLVTGVTAALLAAPAMSAILAGPSAADQHGSMVRGALAAIWVSYLCLTAVMVVAVLRLLRSISARRADRP